MSRLLKLASLFAICVWAMGCFQGTKPLTEEEASLRKRWHAFLATARAGASILMISQSSSEQSFCYTVTDERAMAVKEIVERELADEISNQDVDSVDVSQDVAIVTVVGAGMRHRPGVAGRVFTTLGNNLVNVLAIAQGSSECSISFVVAKPDLESAVRCLHDLALMEE